MSQSPATPELTLIVPVYNEQDSIIAVLEEWRTELRKHTSQLAILVIDDGSKDATPQRLAALDWPELIVHRHTNRGHGQSCLVGYIEAHRRGSRYLFQIDSDGQCDPAGFAGVWALRAEAPAVYGRRIQRDDGFARRLISLVLRLTLRLRCSTKLNDTNVPFRLYDTARAAELAAKIPPAFDLANIAMALRFEPYGFREYPIHFRDRIGGHASVRWWGFGKKALRLMSDLKLLKNA